MLIKPDMKQHNCLLHTSWFVLLLSFVAHCFADEDEISVCGTNLNEGCGTSESYAADKYTDSLQKKVGKGDDSKWSIYLNNIKEAVANYRECVATDCSCYLDVLEADLHPLKNVGGVTRNLLTATKQSLPRIAHYQIIDHKLYRTPQCMFGPRCEGIDHFILGIIDQLPDMEFLLNDRDYPQILNHMGPKPVFSFSKTSGYLDIMYPAWSFWAGGPAISLHPTGIGRWDLMRNKLLR